MRKCQSVDRLFRKLIEMGFAVRMPRPFYRLCLVGAVGLLAVVFWPQVALAEPPSPLNPASAEAQNIANLYWFTFWIALVIFIVVEGLLLYAIIRFRQKDPEITPPKIHGSTPLEIAWTVAPALVLLIVFVLMIRTMNASAKPPANAMQIKVIGHQWWWEFQYPELGIVTGNELYVPVGEPIVAELSSDNVIHSFWIPRLAGKMDVVPGQVNTMWFQADQPGNFRGQCAELCGVQHANMNFMVIALPPEQFEIWAARQQQPAAAAAGAAAEGQQMFLNGQCIACHRIDGTTAQSTLGPNLTHFGSRRTIAGLMLQNTPENLALWLADPQHVKPGNKMVIDPLSQEEIEALVAYLTTLY